MNLWLLDTDTVSFCLAILQWRIKFGTIDVWNVIRPYKLFSIAQLLEESL
jgi:hypothetical protein